MRTFTRRHLLQSAAAAVLAVGCQAEAPDLTREAFVERRAKAQVLLRVCVFDVQGRGFGQGVFA